MVGKTRVLLSPWPTRCHHRNIPLDLCRSQFWGQTRFFVFIIIGYVNAKCPLSQLLYSFSPLYSPTIMLNTIVSLPCANARHTESIKCQHIAYYTVRMLSIFLTPISFKKWTVKVNSPRLTIWKQLCSLTFPSPVQIELLLCCASVCGNAPPATEQRNLWNRLLWPTGWSEVIARSAEPYFPKPDWSCITHGNHL